MLSEQGLRLDAAVGAQDFDVSVAVQNGQRQAQSDSRDETVAEAPNGLPRTTASALKRRRTHRVRERFRGHDLE